MLKSSLRKFYGRHHDLVDRYGISVSQMTTDTFHLSKHFMTYHLVCNQINMMGVISGAGASYPSGTSEFILGFQWGSCYPIYRFYRSLFVLYICMFCRLLFVLLYFFFWSLCCLFFFDIRILITTLVSSNSSYYDHLSFVYEKDMCNMNCLSYQCFNCFLSINVVIFVLLPLLVSQLLLTSTILRSDVSLLAIRIQNIIIWCALSIRKPIILTYPRNHWANFNQTWLKGFLIVSDRSAQLRIYVNRMAVGQSSLIPGVQCTPIKDGTCYLEFTFCTQNNYTNTCFIRMTQNLHSRYVAISLQVLSKTGTFANFSQICKLNLI